MPLKLHSSRSTASQFTPEHPEHFALSPGSIAEIEIVIEEEPVAARMNKAEVGRDVDILFEGIRMYQRLGVSSISFRSDREWVKGRPVIPGTPGEASSNAMDNTGAAE